MNVYDILTPYNYSQKSCVVANNMAEAEKIFLQKYPDTTILKIELHSNYVLIQKD
jgi:hypothetical protein